MPNGSLKTKGLPAVSALNVWHAHGDMQWYWLFCEGEPKHTITKNEQMHVHVEMSLTLDTEDICSCNSKKY